MENKAMIEKPLDKTRTRLERWADSAKELPVYLVLFLLMAVYVAGVIARIMTSRQ
jgi:hypothetical protein